MAIVPKQRSAFWALAAAGGLWAWQNRSKIQTYLKDSGVLNQVNSALNQASSATSHRRTIEGETVQPYTTPSTGQTQRIGGMDMGGEFTTEANTKYDPSI